MGLRPHNLILYYIIMKLPTVKEIVLDKNRIAYLHKVEDGNIYYSFLLEHIMYEFPIPFEETKGGTFYQGMEIRPLMRWIRMALENDELRVIGGKLRGQPSSKELVELFKERKPKDFDEKIAKIYTPDEAFKPKQDGN